jgi:hypothetical protein
VASKELAPAELKAAEDALDAEELALKRKRCKLRGHKWDLPAANPFNHSASLTECETICNRCNARAKVTVTVIEGS